MKSSIEENIKLHELNGIIQGIICDEEINDKEIFKLKKWLDKNSELERIESYQMLCEAVNKILEDSIVTKDEQNELLQMLSKELSNSQFESKLDH